MKRPNDENIVTIREHAHPEIFSAASRQKAVVVQMPSRWGWAEQHTAPVITMPTRIDCAEAYRHARAAEQLQHLPSAVRLTLLALFAWLGWPRPTHGKGPGAAGARPWKPALLNLVATLRLPGAAFRQRRAAAVREFPVSQSATAVELRAA